ncbi:DUF1772 domain-containing protein [Pleomorphomonas sp. PLEO]|uniref:anthrone oxygenase family protein n=1 Tax=Pleomorphomonas sp. PLEO TaxID=3239306 RepID=UPI00351E95FC
MNSWLNLLLFTAALGAAIMGGIFFAFSNFVMPAVAQQPATSGIATIQTINVTVQNPVFLAIFLGTALISIVLVIAVLGIGHPRPFLMIVGAIFYIIGTFGVTVALNVPMNEVLASLPPESPEAHLIWADFLSDWTFWNSIRAAAAVIAATCLVGGVLV